MSKEKLKGKCSRCRNLQVLKYIPFMERLLTGVKPIQPPRHGTLPAPEFPMRPYYYKCKVTNEFLTRMMWKQKEKENVNISKTKMRKF